MGSSIFVSYGHGDMKPVHWLERLKVYLAPLRRDGEFRVWDDSTIQLGEKWRDSIEAAIREAHAAILLVGPAYLASEFVSKKELPQLLRAGEERGLKILPLIVGYCSYRQSVLAPYQSHNGPDQPLESLSSAEQNRILNEFAEAVDRAVRHSSLAKDAMDSKETGRLDALAELQTQLRDSRKAFEAQCKQRNELHAALVRRLKASEDLEYERFFYRHFDEMNRDERFLFDRIRTLTEGPLYEANRRMLEILESQPALLDEVSELTDLRQHLVFWLNKYERLFVNTPEMCLLYVGVEDGVGFPTGLDEVVEGLIAPAR